MTDTFSGIAADMGLPEFLLSRESLEPIVDAEDIFLDITLKS